MPFWGKNREMRKYIGWVPCVAGKLFFKHIKCGLASPFSSLTINHIEPDLSPTNEIILDKKSGLIQYQRYICLTSCYNWKDGSEGDGNFRIVVIGKATNNSGIKGCVCIIPKEIGSKLNDWKKILKQIQNLKKEIKDAQHNKIDIRVGTEHSQIQSKLDEFENIEYYKIPFEIDRSGFTELDYNGIGKGHLHEFTLVRQAFYYLKYSIHVHQHHNKGEDSLTTIHLVPKDQKEIGEQLLDDLKESMVAMKREHGSTGYHRLYDNKGVNSYAKSLMESCKQKEYISDENYLYQSNYLNNIYGSMETTAQKAERSINIGISASNSARSALLLLFALIAPFTLIYLEKIRVALPKDIHDAAIPSWIFNLLIKVSSSTEGIVWSGIAIISVFVFLRIERFKYAGVLLLSKPISKLFSHLITNTKLGYLLTFLIILISCSLVIIAFKFYK